MKNVRNILLLFFISTATVSAQEKIPEVTARQAKNYDGKKVTICSQVKDVYVNKRAKGEPTMLNFGAPYPNQTFTVIIWKDNLKNFDNDPATYYQDKNICVTGDIIMYRGRPEIEVKTPYQIYE